MFANFNPWHHVSPGDKDSLPYVVNGIIEIPKGTRAKYELDKASGLLRLDRVLYSSVYYPANYGFIPRTYGADKDPLDILILSQAEVVPMCIVPARISALCACWITARRTIKLSAWPRATRT